jgi:restriction system protein
VAHIIAALLLIVALGSAILSWQKRKLLEKQKDLSTVSNINWKEFEELVGEAYRRQGYFVLENSSDGPDGGVDLRLRKDDELVLVQCKHWKAQKVNVKIIRELYGIMASRKANRGIVVTYGSFTQEAKDFARGKPLELVDGQKLMALIERVQKNNKTDQITKINVQRNHKTEQATSITKTCNLCGSEMVPRKAKTGKYAGQQFWGCKAFPKCRGISSY